MLVGENFYNSVDLAEIGGMDITLDPLDESERVQLPYTSNNKYDKIQGGSSDAMSGDEKDRSEEDGPKMRLEFNETKLDILVGKGAPKKSIWLSKINLLAFKNLFRLAREKLMKLHLLDMRLAANERKYCKRMLAVEVLEEVTGITSDDEDEMTKQGFAMFGF